MPLDTIEDPFELSSFESVKQNFVIFYASRDYDGNMWCPVSYPTSTSLRRNTAMPPSAQRRAGLMFRVARICTDQPSPHILNRRHRRYQDCRNVEEIIERTFAPADGPTGLIVYVGGRLECVDPHPPRPFPPSPIGVGVRKVVLKKRDVHSCIALPTRPQPAFVSLPIIVG